MYVCAVGTYFLNIFYQIAERRILLRVSALRRENIREGGWKRWGENCMTDDQRWERATYFSVRPPSSATWGNLFSNCLFATCHSATAFPLSVITMFLAVRNFLMKCCFAMAYLPFYSRLQNCRLKKSAELWLQIFRIGFAHFRNSRPDLGSDLSGFEIICLCRAGSRSKKISDAYLDLAPDPKLKWK